MGAFPNPFKLDDATQKYAKIDQVVEPYQGPGNSLLVGLEHLDFNKNGELKEGAWGILTLSGDLANFTFSSPKNLPFLKTVKRETYRSLLNK